MDDSTQCSADNSGTSATSSDTPVTPPAVLKPLPSNTELETRSATFNFSTKDRRGKELHFRDQTPERGRY
jgi:hypothetical protein